MTEPPEGGVSSENVALGSKRQRRPSVRLGDIGDQPATLSYDHLYVRRTSSSVKHHHRHNKDTAEIDEDNNNADLVSVRRAKRGGGTTKRARSNLVSKHDQETNAAAAVDSGDEGSREFDPEEGSQSSLKEHTPLHSQDKHPAADRDKQGLFSGKRKSARSTEHRHDEVELDGPSDTDARDWKCGTSAERNEGANATAFWSLEDGVRMWLNGLGLPQYAPVFEIHEVDEQVLPQLTLDDLKDMGINAVGSRRKLYSAIQKLAKGFS